MRIAIVALVVLAAGCAAAPAGTGSIDGDWLLVSGIDTVADWPITMEIDVDTWGARVCNWMGGEVDRDRGRFVVGDVERTAMSCGPEVDAVEEAFLGAIAAVEEASVDDDELTLAGPDTRLVFVRRAEVEPAAVVDTRWEVDTLVDGDTARTPDAGAWVEFGSDGTFSGWTGCRDLTGTHVLDGADVRMTSLAADGECPPELADQDGFVIGVLEAPTATIDGDRLTLSASGGNALVLVRP